MKSRKKAAPSRATEASHRLPAFMLGDLGKGKPNITASDVPWVGEDGELPDEILRGDLGPMSSIELVFMALIAAHPIGTKRAKPDRLRDMSKALYGVKKDGPKALVADDELLVHMARNHHMDHLGFSGLKRSDAQLARDAVDALPLDHALKKRGFPESRARRLQRKFRRDFDRLMVRVSSGDFPEVIARWRIRQEIYERLARLGVKVDPTVDPCPDATPPR